MKLASIETISEVKKHPIDTGIDRSTYIITDIDYMPGEFFNENFTSSNIHEIKKYINGI